MQFEWDDTKDEINKRKHGISGKVDDEIVTLRFTVRGNKIRIIGAGYWRKGKKIYEKENY